jgi:hypothetical protein
MNIFLPFRQNCIIDLRFIILTLYPKSIAVKFEYKVSKHGETQGLKMISLCFILLLFLTFFPCLSRIKYPYFNFFKQEITKKAKVKTHY